MICGQIDFPDKLIRAMREQKLVVFAGAGVSMGEPARLPSFRELAEQLADGTGRTPYEPLDRFLGELQHQGTKLHERAATFLAREGLEPTPLHRDLLRLFKDSKAARIVTTNFDLLFEKAAQSLWGESPDVFRAPALPLGDDFNGIVYIHGSVQRPRELVLTDSDFGRAYLTKGWARQFLLDLFSTYTVLFVGYSHEDMVMHYLARALPPGDGNRFVLNSDDSNPVTWSSKGIELITFPKPQGKHDFSCLRDGIHKLANFACRSVIDWQRVIGELASKAPPPDQPSAQEETDLLKHAFSDEVKTRFFAERARHIEWLRWLGRHNLLEPLFHDAPLDAPSAILSRWLADEYIHQHANDCFALFEKRRLTLNPQFWSDVAKSLTRSEATITAEVFSKWISVLLDSAPSSASDFELHWLAEKAQSLGCHECSVALFTRSIRGKLSFRRGLVFSGEARPEPRVQINLSNDRHGWVQKEIWTNAISPHLDTVAQMAVSQLVPLLEQRHLTYVAWKQSHGSWDDDSFGRRAIERHEQNRYCDTLDIVIDAVRDSLEILAATQPAQFTAWTRLLLASRAPLLRRLGVHATGINNHNTATEKVALLMELELLFDPAVHHEVFTLLKKHYTHTSKAIRKKLVQAIEGITVPKEIEDSSLLGVQTRYRWLHWLTQSDPKCAIATEALRSLVAANPELNALSVEHADFTHWSDVTRHGPGSPWSVEQLLQRSPKEWLPELRAFKKIRFDGSDPYEFQQVIAEASKQDETWGIDLAKSLADEKHWESDVWSGLLRGWQQWPEDAETAKKRIQCLNHRELLAAKGREIADVLFGLWKDEPPKCVKELLPQTNEIARTLWPLIDRSHADLIGNNWLTTAINRPAGILAKYWLKCLAIAVQPVTEANQAPLDAFADIDVLLQDSSPAGGCARAFLASQFTYLHYLLIPALLIGFQFSPAEEGFEEWRSEVLVVEGLADQVAELEHIVGQPVGQVRVLGMVPDPHQNQPSP